MVAILFIIIINVLIFVHELGHFLACRAVGVKVTDFALGFPPKLFNWKRGDTTYALNLVPFGGYVKIFGDDSSEPVDQNATDAFVNKSKSKQALILVAGIVFNVIFAWLLFSAALSLGVSLPAGYGKENDQIEYSTMITGAMPDSPAAKAGLLPGDVITNAFFVDDSQALETDRQPVTRLAEVQSLIDSSKDHGGIKIAYERKGESFTSIAIEPVSGLIENKYAIGIAMEETAFSKLQVYKALVEGLKMTVSMCKEIFIGLYQLLANMFSGNGGLKDLSGPVAIASMAGSAKQIGFSYLLLFTGFISLNLAAFNLLPFPALDGGRLLFVLIEKIKGSAIKPSVAAAVNSIGFSLLILLMIVVTYRDIAKLFR